MTNIDISVDNIHCFEENAKLENLGIINVVYGPNGSGKTSISSALSENSRDHFAFEARVYNRDYIYSVFAANETLPGVFLLGEDTIQLQQEISDLEAELRKEQGKLDKINSNLESKESELASLNSNLATDLWSAREQVPSEALKQMKHSKSNKASFANYAKEQAALVVDSLREWEDTLNEINTVLTEGALPIPEPPSLNVETLQFEELARILQDPITPANESLLSHLIGQLDNANWVRTGITHLISPKNPGSLCPFCQQETPDDLKAQLKELFNDAYNEQLCEMTKCIEASQVNCSDTISWLDSVKEHATTLNLGKKHQECEQAMLKIQSDIIECSQNKRADPAASIQLSNALNEHCDLLNLRVDYVKNRANYNSKLEDKTARAKTVEAEIWQHFTRNIAGPIIERYTKNYEILVKAIRGLSSGKKEKSKLVSEINTKISEINRRTTNSRAAADFINETLLAAGFHSFKLTPVENDGYMISRRNETKADFKTLSEGEKSFVTFIYYLYSLRSKSGEQPSNRLLAVIDDPISSLDDDILFMTAHLIRNLNQQVQDGDHETVSRVLLLTHNTKFHNEVCYRSKPPITHFKIIKNSPLQNQIIRCGKENPIRTAYQSLWDNVKFARDAAGQSHPWLPNTLRRIVETYFSLLGGDTDLYLIGDNLSTPERSVHRSLIAWMHSGSHSVFESESVFTSEPAPSIWFGAFERIFSSTGHAAHFNMMMENAADRGKG